MFQDDNAAVKSNGSSAVSTAGNKDKTYIIAVLICASLCVFFIRSGFLSFFFLVPLGYAVLVYNSFFHIVTVTAGLNLVLSLIMGMGSQNQYSLWFDVIYLTAMFAGFAWIMTVDKYRIRTVYRLILASAAVSLVFLFLLFGNRDSSGFIQLIRDQAEEFSSIFLSFSAGDAVRQSYLQQILTPDNLLDAFISIFLRGGAVAAMLLIFYLNRQIVIAIVRIVKKQGSSPGLAAFFAPVNTIWVLSCSLALILLTRLFNLEIPEIIAWNVFVVCVILFLAQGTGIVFYLLARRSPAFRIFSGILIVFVMLSLGINTIAIAALLLLGIAENWVPFRSKELKIKAE